MPFITLRKGAGIGELAYQGSIVRSAQKPLGVTVDGHFGSKTKAAVEDFQAAVGVVVTGIVDRTTWPELDYVEMPTEARKLLLGFEGGLGGLGTIHLWEGHNGVPYWPGGNSGVTLDPGLDLGHAGRDFIEDMLDRFYHLSTDEREAVAVVVGIRGEDAQRFIDRNHDLHSIRISHELAETVLPHALAPYWRAITKRFPDMLHDFAPRPAVETALLSLAYNRGPGNADLEALGPLIEEEDWPALAGVISQMQQDHPLAGVRRRRREEGLLIFDEIDYLEA